MFSPVPSLEELSLRVEVEWEDRIQHVVVRVEAWPGAGYAVLSCVLEETGGKYFVRSGKAFYQTGTSERWFCRYAATDDCSDKPCNKIKFSARGEEKFRSIVRRAFAFNNADWGVIRLIQLPQLPNKPRVVADFVDSLCWCPTPDPLWPNLVPFRLLSAPTALAPTENAAQQQLLSAWNDKSSDAYFAWNWAILSQKERYSLLTGFDGDWQELQTVMRLILTGASTLWREETALEWVFRPTEPWSNLDSGTDNEEAADVIVEAWHPILQSYFAPSWQENRLATHICVEQFWSQCGILRSVSIDSPPTAHEQLEAKLALRDWLADKATPAQTARLLASLDS